MPFSYSPDPRRFPTLVTNIQLILEEHLPVEHTAVEERISSLLSQLEELYEYRTWLNGVASAASIRITDDRQGGESSNPPDLQQTLLREGQ